MKLFLGDARDGGRKRCVKTPGGDPEVLTAIAVRTWKIGRLLAFQKERRN